MFYSAAMGMTGIWTQTQREKLGTIDGINLFFGALLGANLGTLGTVPLDDYVKLVLLLVGLVVTIRIVSVSERRGYAYGLLVFYLGLAAAFFFVPAFQPEGLAEADLNRVVATLAVWVTVTTVVELYPTADSLPAKPAVDDDAAIGRDAPRR